MPGKLNALCWDCKRFGTWDQKMHWWTCSMCGRRLRVESLYRRMVKAVRP